MRIPVPYFRSQRRCWYVQIGKKQHNLGKDEAKAKELYKELISATEEQAASDHRLTVVALLTAFLDWVKRNQSAATLDFYSRPLLSFGQFIGERMLVNDLKNHHVTNWLKKIAKENGAGRTPAVRAVKRALNWAKEEQYIKASPISVKAGASGRREVLITPDQWDKVLSSVNDSFGELLRFMRETGCRPQEARQLEARHFDKQRRLIVLPKAEAKGKRKPRTIFLSDAAFQQLDGLAETRPTGKLFLNASGKAWTKDNIGLRLRRLRKKLDIPGLVAYCARHSFGTEAIVRGMDTLVVAKLMGHSNTKMIQQHYEHLAENPEFLTAMANKAGGGQPQQTAQPGSQSGAA